MITFQFLFLYFFALNTCSSKEVESANNISKDGGIDVKLSALELDHDALQMEFSALQLRYHQQEDRLHSLEKRIPNIIVVSDGFSNWGECDVTCGGGTQTRDSLACSNTDTDQDCKETKVESQSCNTQSCLTSVFQPGVTYIRWGRTTCPTNGTERVYTGSAAGSHYTHSGGVDYLCLPDDPEEGSPTLTVSSSRIYGAEYEVFGDASETLFGDQVGQHDVPCSVCQSTVRSSILMTPGRLHCYDGWHLEYNGYMMSSLYNHVNSKTFACMDINPEKLDGGQANADGALFYPVVTRCGSLRCPPYKNNQVVTCSVCTK